MAARKNPRPSRETIEKIRSTIDTRAAIAELHRIGHDTALPAGVRVKALAVLVDKTLPSLTERDISVQIEHADPVQMIHRLTAILGHDEVKRRWPDVYSKVLDMPKRIALDTSTDAEELG